MGVESVAREEQVGGDFAAPKSWAEAVAPRVQKPMPADKQPLVEPVILEAGEPPEPKKRRTQESPERTACCNDATYVCTARVTAAAATTESPSYTVGA